MFRPYGERCKVLDYRPSTRKTLEFRCFVNSVIALASVVSLFKSEQAATEVTLMQVYRNWGTASEEEKEV